MIADFQKWIDSQSEILDAIAQHHANQWHSAAKLLVGLDRLKERWDDRPVAEVYEAAQGLLSGDSIHNQGGMILDVMQSVFCPDPMLVAAAMRLAWQGGKVGFNFLPDPADADPEDYDMAADFVLEALTGEWAFAAPALLADGQDDDDLAFYRSLPERFTVYRGGHGLPPERLALGLCWTARRSVAEWFALRGPGKEPVVVSGRISKDRIATVFSNEHEIVCRPWPWRALKCRRKSLGKRPEMAWCPDSDRPSTPAPAPD